jgi:FkbM family methyltransferase
MAWDDTFGLKWRRRWRKPFNKLAHRRYFISRYRGADFLLRPDGISTLEISAKIAERPELTDFMARCAKLQPELFIDVGANIGLYACILLKNHSAPRAILFEPDRRNLIQLKANLLINGLVERADVHELALGDAPGRQCFYPSPIDGGFSRIVARSDSGGVDYEVQVARLDDMISLCNRTLAIKIDVEDYECQVIAGMAKLLRNNQCLVQIEAFDHSRDQVASLMTVAGYDLAASYFPNFVFEPRTAQAASASGAPLSFTG